MPKEIKQSEKRVALTPACVKALSDRNHQVFVEAGAGNGSGFSDEEYSQAGARMLDRAEDPALRGGLNVCEGQLTCHSVAECFGMRCTTLDL